MLNINLKDSKMIKVKNDITNVEFYLAQEMYTEAKIILDEMFQSGCDDELMFKYLGWLEFSRFGNYMKSSQYYQLALNVASGDKAEYERNLLILKEINQVSKLLVEVHSLLASPGTNST